MLRYSRRGWILFYILLINEYNSKRSQYVVLTGRDILNMSPIDVNTSILTP